MGDRAHEAVDLRIEADGARQLARALAHLTVERPLARQAQVPAARAEHGEVEVVLDAEAEEQTGLLVGAPHPQPRAPGGGDGADVLAEELDRARRLRHVARDDVEQRRLPGAVGPRMARLSPGATSRSTSRTASRPPNRRPTPRKRRIGPACSVVTPSTACYPPTTFTGVALPSHGRLFFSHAGEVTPRSGSGAAERAAERLVDVRDGRHGLDRQLAVLGVELLVVDREDGLAVLVQLDRAVRGRQLRLGQRGLELGLVGDVALDGLEALDAGPRCSGSSRT